MPELPDIAIYVERLRVFVLGKRLQRIQVAAPFVLRTFAPRITELEGREPISVERLGKRIVMGFEDELFLVIHLMIAGRLRWKPPGTKPPKRNGLAAFDFADGTLMLTEAATKRRASLHVLRGAEDLRDHDRGGLEVLDADLESFAERLRRESHTLKRSLTDPRLFSGIGGAYGDEIMHRARLSPVKLTSKLEDTEIERLHVAAREVLEEWTARFREEVGEGFPDKVTAFRPEMAVHGKHGEPCPVCGSPVQRIVHRDNETNYCPECQTGGRILADRALSRLLGRDWPRTLEDLLDLRSRPDA